MPVIQLDTGAALSREQKAELVRVLTARASEIMGVPQEAYVVIIRAHPEDSVGVGGKTLAERHGHEA
jgi:4-oxalocrotonate tautomerase